MIADFFQTLSIGLKISLAILFVIALVCIAPWLLFWSIGQLFGVVVEFSFWNVVAAIVLLVL